MTSALLVTEGLTKAFGALRVTDDVSIDLKPGEIHAVIGPNGAGKTTLINQLSGRLPVDGGRVFFEGSDITQLSMAARAKLGIARTFQITSVLEGFSVLENAALAVQARRGSSFRFFKRADREQSLDDEALQALETVNLADRATVQAGTLSHGEKRQLELAIALATKPRLLLLDEPLAGTGHDESAALTGLIGALKSSYGIMLIEHDMDAVFALADRVSVLVYGRIVKTGIPAEVRADPDVRAAYLGDEVS